MPDWPSIPSPRWLEICNQFQLLLDEVEVTPATVTQLVELKLFPVSSPKQFELKLKGLTRNDPDWAHALYSVGGPRKQGSKLVGLAMPVASGKAKTPLAEFFPYVATHSAMIAWWLVTAWRVRQLADVCTRSARSGELLVAAACARSLIETAASFTADACKVEKAWHQIKHAADLPVAKHYQVLGPIQDALLGAKFDDTTPIFKAAFPVERTNAYTHVQKLSKQWGNELAEAYALLCNTVHPSAGNLLAFRAEPLIDPVGAAYRTTLISSEASRLQKDATRRGVGPEMIVPASIDLIIQIALTILTYDLDAVLMLADDVSLTSGAPTLSRIEYWRMTTPPSTPEEQCPCRSGRTWRECGELVHQWGTQQAPDMPICHKPRPTEPSKRR